MKVYVGFKIWYKFMWHDELIDEYENWMSLARDLVERFGVGN